MKKEKYEKEQSVNQRSGSTEKAGRRHENDAKSQELHTCVLTYIFMGPGWLYGHICVKSYLCEFIFPHILDGCVHTQTQSYMCSFIFLCVSVM